MKLLLIFIITLLFQIACQAQFFSNTIIKTRPLIGIVAFNPSFGFEKPISKKVSLEIDFMYRNKVWNSTGNEGDYGRFYNGDGYRLLLGSRVYFGKSNNYFSDATQNAPFGWFGVMQIAHSYAISYNIHFSKGDIESFYVNSYKNWGNLNIGLGKQFYFFNCISFEIYLGPTFRTGFTEKYKHISQNNFDPDLSQNRDGVISAFGSITFGYYIK